MKERFGMKSYVNQAEMFKSSDGKFRYDRKLREEMFQFITKQFKNKSPSWKLFLCMEQPETWLNTFNSMPKSQKGIKELFVR